MTDDENNEYFKSIVKAVKINICESYLKPFNKQECKEYEMSDCLSCSKDFILGYKSRDKEISGLIKQIESMKSCKNCRYNDYKFVNNGCNGNCVKINGKESYQDWKLME